MDYLVQSFDYHKDHLTTKDGQKKTEASVNWSNKRKDGSYVLSRKKNEGQKAGQGVLKLAVDKMK